MLARSDALCAFGRNSANRSMLAELYIHSLVHVERQPVCRGGGVGGACKGSVWCCIVCMLNKRCV